MNLDWLAGQPEDVSDRYNSCYVLAAAQAKKWLRGAVCPYSDGQKSQNCKET